jgi:glycosyltransferase involved in cell wall biosynthesis
MKVGLNATCFNDRPSGAKQRLIGLYGELFRRSPEIEFVVFEAEDCRVAEWFDCLPNVSGHPTPIPSSGRLRRVAVGSLYWPKAWSNSSFDIFESFHLPLTRFPNARNVLTIHDIRGIRAGNNMVEHLISKTILGRSIKAADHIITVSNAMKDEIKSFAPDARVSVIYNGFSPALDEVKPDDITAFQTKYNLPQGYVLAVGHIEKRKRYLHLVDAMSLLRVRGIDAPLLIIGNDSGERQTLESRISALKMNDRVTILNGLSDAEVRCAYKLSSLFVFPSEYEGFGIPILEAMAASCPIALSDIPVFREITEGQSLFFDCHNLEATCNAIQIGLTSTEERFRMTGYGSKRVKDFSFGRLASKLEDLYLRGKDIS